MDSKPLQIAEIDSGRDFSERATIGTALIDDG
jgi:hypothetical protein